MTTIELDDDVVEKLRWIAERQNRSLTEFLGVIAEEYVDEAPQKMTRTEARRALADYIKSDVPDSADHVEEANAPVTEEQVVGNLVEKEALEVLIGIFDDDITDLSTTVHETLDQYYRSRYADSD